MKICKKYIGLFNIIFISILLVFTFSCKKDPSANNDIQTGTITDIDGNVYKTIKIGNQWWMAENLRVTRFRDGVKSLKLISANNQNIWDTLKSAAYCIFDDNDTVKKWSGLLYNWYVINGNDNIAPAGWHIPVDAEWKELEMNLGMSSSDAGKTGWRGNHEGELLKKAIGWTEYGTVWNTNESGFSALGGGCRMFDGSQGEPGLKATGFWWTKTDLQGGNAWYRYLDYKNSNVFRYYGPKSYGFSIRCVKD